MTCREWTAVAKPHAALRRLTASLIAVFALEAIGAANPTFAQTNPATAGPIQLGELFTGPESVDLKPGAEQTFKDAVRNARAAWDGLAPGQCPRPKITVTVIAGDDLFQQAFVAARREVLRDLIGRDADLFQFVEDIKGSANNVEIDTSVADAAPPTITVDPPSGTSVRHGQRLTITVTATEPSTGWQSGVRQVQIEDVDRRTNLEPWNNPAPPPRPCGNAGLERKIERRYEVPMDVPVARLKITARDYHNFPQPVPIEYPIEGEWSGTFRMITPPLHVYRTEADIILNHDGRGNLTGTMTGQQEVIPYSTGSCSVQTIQPNRFRVSLVGAYRDRHSFKVLIQDVGETKLIWRATCPGHVRPTYDGEHTFKTGIWPPEAFLGTPSALGEGEILPDGTRQYKFELGGTTATVTLKPVTN